MKYDAIVDVVSSMNAGANGEYHLCRYGWYNAKGRVHNYDHVCVAYLRHNLGHYEKGGGIYALFNGQPKDIHFQGKLNPSCYDKFKEMAFEGGPDSLRWLQFLLDPIFSPYRAILPHLDETDPEVINKTLAIHICKDLDKLPYELMFNFLIAARWCFEFNSKFKFWLKLQDEYGCTPNEAYVIAIGWLESGGGLVNQAMCSAHEPLSGFARNIRRICFDGPSFKGTRPVVGENRNGLGNCWNIFVNFDDDELLPKLFERGSHKIEDIVQYVRYFTIPGKINEIKEVQPVLKVTAGPINPKKDDPDYDYMIEDEDWYDDGYDDEAEEERDFA